MQSNEHSLFPQPKIVNQPTADDPDPVVFKQLHLPARLIPLRLGRYIKASTDKEKEFRKREKNRLRRLRARNKKKKKLPPLPTGHVGDPRVYYQRTYNINLFDYKVIFELTFLQQSLYQEIWTKHNSNLHTWERSHNITKHNKRRYKFRHRKRNNSQNTHINDQSPNVADTDSTVRTPQCHPESLRPRPRDNTWMILITSIYLHSMIVYDKNGGRSPANGCSMNYTAWAYTIGLE
ncbi:hypothetical protein RhiirC2_721095, partial [Rhizophagus irregularis]